MTITLSAYTRTATNRSREDRFVPVGPRQTYLHANRFSKRGGRLRTRAWVPFDWQNEWGRVAFRFLGQCYHTGRVQCDNTLQMTGEVAMQVLPGDSGPDQGQLLAAAGG